MKPTTISLIGAVIVAFGVACGTTVESNDGQPDGGLGDSAPDADGGDACGFCGDGVECTIDTCVDGQCLHEADDGLCEAGLCDANRGCVSCLEDAHCDDETPCTVDACDDGECVSTPDDDQCEAGTLCRPGIGCVVCAVDSDCDDGRQCTVDQCFDQACTYTPDDVRCTAGAPHCSPTLGCVACLDDTHCSPSSPCVGIATCVDGGCTRTEPLNCDDGIACTHDSCLDAGEGRCENARDPALCRADETCDATSGCVRGNVLYANTSSALYLIDYGALPSPTVSRIGSFGTEVTDLALSSDGVLYGCSRTELLTVNHATGDVSLVGSFGLGTDVDIVGCAAAEDGTLYAGSGWRAPEWEAPYDWGSLFEVDTHTGTATFVGHYGEGLATSGDVVWVPDQGILASHGLAESSSILAIDSITGAAANLFDTGFAEIYGLSHVDGELFGFCGGGELISIDLESETASLVADLSLAWWGSS